MARGQASNVRRARLPAVTEIPQDIPGLKLWLDATKLTGLSDLDPVTTWTDASGNGSHATQGTAAAKPTYRTAIQNGLPVVRFDGGDHLEANGASGIFSGTDLPLSVFVVAKVDNTTGAHTFVGPGHATGSALYELRNSGVEGFAIQGIRRDDTGFDDRTGAGTPDTNWHVYAWVSPGTTFGAWLDATNPIAAGTSWNVGLTTINQVGIGALRNQAAVSNPVLGDIGEIVAYNVAVSASDRQALIDYLTDKWLGAAPVAVRVPALTSQYGGYY